MDSLAIMVLQLEGSTWELLAPLNVGSLCSLAIMVLQLEGSTWELLAPLNVDSLDSLVTTLEWQAPLYKDSLATLVCQLQRNTWELQAHHHPYSLYLKQACPHSLVLT